MKQKKYLKKILVVLLCYAMLPFSVPASAVNEPETATELAQIATTDTGIAMDETIAADDNAVLVKPEGAEVVSLREENVKHFDMGNGTYQAISYSHPVHELDSEGNWQDIDFSMHLTQTRGISTYTNTAGTALAANYIANQPILSMSGENTAIDMTFIYAKEGVAARAGTVTTAVAEVTQAETAIETYEDTQDINFSNTLYYNDVMPGVDLEYIVDPWNVKENIIVKEKARSYTYMFKLNLEGLYPVLQNDGSIFLLNAQTDKQEYVIPAPYMYDAYGEMSFDVSYTITGSNGTYYLSVTADSTWINAADRIFPITIDPSISTHIDYAIMDTYITGDLPNEARGMHKFLFVGENEVAYIQVPTPSFSFDIEINEAHLALNYFYKDFVKSGYVDVTAHRVTELVWLEEFLTWQTIINRGLINFGLQSVAQGDAVRTYGTVGATSASPKLVNIDITSAVKGWVEYGIANDGIGLKYVTESPNRSVMFRSKEGPAQYRPCLVYNYTIVPKYEVNLILQYDDSYKEILELDEVTQAWIKAEADIMADFFLTNFSIEINYQMPSSCQSYYDLCTNKNDEGFCNCTDSSDCNNNVDTPNHHSNIFANHAHMLSPDESSIRMLYIGAPACYKTEEQGHNTVEDGFGGFSDMTMRTIVINNHRGAMSEIVTVIHEMGHMFGARDHIVYENNLERDQCMYGFSGYNGSDPYNIKLCSECRNKINSNRGIYCGGN